MSQLDPSDLDIIIREYGIDMNQCPKTSYGEQLKYVQDCIRSYPLQTYDLQKSLNNACDRINRLVTSYLMKRISGRGNKASQIFATAAGFGAIPSSVEAILDAYTQKVNRADIMLLSKAFKESVKDIYYRKFGFEVIEGEVTNYSQPDESARVLSECRAAAQVYTNAKFSHLSCLCYNPASLK